ncbi:bone morphogenetic protein receptor type-1A, partial [Lates japonicus]
MEPPVRVLDPKSHPAHGPADQKRSGLSGLGPDLVSVQVYCRMAGLPFCLAVMAAALLLTLRADAAGQNPDHVLQGTGVKPEARRPGEDSTIAPEDAARFLSCYCSGHCPEDATNNTC